MNKQEYLVALAQALAGLPDEERENAIRYYEDYFADAGEQNEAQVLQELDSPETVAQAILNDYRELTVTASSHTDSAEAKETARKKGINPWVLLVLVLLAIPVGLPLLGAAIGLIIALFSVILTVALILLLLPIILCIVGFAVGWAGLLTLFVHPASGVLAIGGGFICLAIGLLLAALFVKLWIVIVPPLVRGIVNLCRKPFERGKRS